MGSTFEGFDDELLLAGLRGLGLFAGQIVGLGAAAVVVVVGGVVVVVEEAVFGVGLGLRLGLFHRRRCERRRGRRGGGGGG